MSTLLTVPSTFFPSAGSPAYAATARQNTAANERARTFLIASSCPTRRGERRAGNGPGHRTAGHSIGSVGPGPGPISGSQTERRRADRYQSSARNACSITHARRRLTPPESLPDNRPPAPSRGRSFAHDPQERPGRKAAGSDGSPRLPPRHSRRVPRLGRPRGRWTVLIGLRPGGGIQGARKPRLSGGGARAHDGRNRPPHLVRLQQDDRALSGGRRRLSRRDEAPGTEVGGRLGIRPDRGLRSDHRDLRLLGRGPDLLDPAGGLALPVPADQVHRPRPSDPPEPARGEGERDGPRPDLP